MSQFNIPSIVINKKTRDEAEVQQKNIFKTAHTGYNVILVTPEMLSAQSFGGWFINLPDIMLHLFALMINKVHLLYIWGPAFRPEYMQIGHLRKCFLEHTVIVAFTVTLCAGKPKDSHSNACYEIHLTVKQFPHGAQSEHFSELDWVLGNKGKILTYHLSIKFGDKVLHYLLEQSEARKWAICAYNALYTPGYNWETINLLCQDHNMIVIATDSLAVGIDVPDINLAIVIDPDDINNGIQKLGHVERDKSKVPSPQGILYLSSSIMKNAQKTIADAKENPQKCIDMSLSKTVLTASKLKCINELYNNPASSGKFTR
ncbi:ATP-dependent DNA helicase Rec Q [Moniliophthora roreri]|nr:ATP-dependent DNA helicase Rec Q [Moniliophthora roreri]